ncbi:hypothetical protein JRQ81_011460 [Phrynocephalus forsythii]|uniref:Uncharacterized protein n=1 Tax=Phrynocephalus forsythii TaxID=171643 RepID=A0A9Q1AQ28_9SAUR|nr:hypothetical protein JRQ81_011460 [Phrynocephalus forsythii]
MVGCRPAPPTLFLRWFGSGVAEPSELEPAKDRAQTPRFRPKPGPDGRVPAILSPCPRGPAGAAPGKEAEQPPPGPPQSPP